MESRVSSDRFERSINDPRVPCNRNSFSPPRQRLSRFRNFHRAFPAYRARPDVSATRRGIRGARSAYRYFASHANTRADRRAHLASITRILARDAL